MSGLLIFYNKQSSYGKVNFYLLVSDRLLLERRASRKDFPDSGLDFFINGLAL